MSKVGSTYLLCCCQIYEGSDETRALKYSGKKKPDDISATSGKLFVEFTTNPAGNDVGFSAEFSIGNSPYCY